MKFGYHWLQTTRVITAAVVLLFLALGLACQQAPNDPPRQANACVLVADGESTWQKGASIHSYGSDSFGSSDFPNQAFRASLRDLAGINANYVTLVIEYGQENTDSSEINATANTPMDDALGEAIACAHDTGLRVNLKLHLEVTDLSWRANIDAADRPAWFASYGQVLDHYAELAERHQVEMLTVGAELVRMAGSHVDESNEQYWRDMIASIRDQYSGQLTYSAQWGGTSLYEEAKNIRFWDALDYIGIAAFYEFEPPYEIDSLVDQWDQINNEHIAPLHEQWGMPVLLTEVGYRSAEGALARPWEWREDAQVNEEEQALGYEALFSYWQQHDWMQGIHIWDWHGNPLAYDPTGYSPQGKAAEDVMRRWFER